LVYKAQLTKSAPTYRIAQHYQRNLYIVEKYKVRQIKVIQGRWFWHQSKGHMRLPISH